MKKIGLSLLMLAVASLGYSASKQTLEKITIDFRYNTVSDDGKNYIAWKSDSEKKRDRYDAATGASLFRATQRFAEFAVSSKNKVMPKGLRALALYAVSPHSAAVTDALTVQQDAQNPRHLVIHFVHRGIAYRIETDERGRLDTESSFSIAEDVAENSKGVFTLVRSALPGGKPQEPEPAAAEAESATETSEPTAGTSADTAKPEDAEPATDAAASEPAAVEELPPFEGDATDMHNIVWENIDFTCDTADSKAQKYYAATLRASCKAGILRISGKLIPQERKKTE